MIGPRPDPLGSWYRRNARRETGCHPWSVERDALSSRLPPPVVPSLAPYRSSVTNTDFRRTMIVGGSRPSDLYIFDPARRDADHPRRSVVRKLRTSEPAVYADPYADPPVPIDGWFERRLPYVRRGDALLQADAKRRGLSMRAYYAMEPYPITGRSRQRDINAAEVVSVDALGKRPLPFTLDESQEWENAELAGHHYATRERGLELDATHQVEIPDPDDGDPILTLMVVFAVDKIIRSFGFTQQQSVAYLATPYASQGKIARRLGVDQSTVSRWQGDVRAGIGVDDALYRPRVGRRAVA